MRSHIARTLRRCLSTASTTSSSLPEVAAFDSAMQRGRLELAHDALTRAEDILALVVGPRGQREWSRGEPSLVEEVLSRGVAYARFRGLLDSELEGRRELLEFQLSGPKGEEDSGRRRIDAVSRLAAGLTPTASG